MALYTTAPMSSGRILTSLNGNILPVEDAKVSVLDRGFMFGDGAYEVIRIYNGIAFATREHMERLLKSLDVLQIRGVDLVEMEKRVHALVSQAPFRDATVYIQITRGAFPMRKHSFGGEEEVPLDGSPFEDAPPTNLGQPTELLMVIPFRDQNAPLRDSGCATILYPDIRWKRCDIKSLNMLGGVLAAQAAKEAGVYEAIFVDDVGCITEGFHTNVFAVIGDTVRTMPNGEKILPGVTRNMIAERIRVLDIPFDERPFSTDELHNADEVFLTGTTTEVMPVTSVDHKPVHGRRIGKVTRALQEDFRLYRDTLLHSQVS